MVRSVVREELVPIRQELDKVEKRLSKNLIERIDEKFEENYAKYRDIVITKLDKVIAELKKGYEELTVHSGKHVEINDRLENLEAIHPNSKHI